MKLILKSLTKSFLQPCSLDLIFPATTFISKCRPETFRSPMLAAESAALHGLSKLPIHSFWLSLVEKIKSEPCEALTIKLKVRNTITIIWPSVLLEDLLRNGKQRGYFRHGNGSISRSDGFALIFTGESARRKPRRPWSQSSAAALLGGLLSQKIPVFLRIFIPMKYLESLVFPFIHGFGHFGGK